MILQKFTCKISPITLKNVDYFKRYLKFKKTLKFKLLRAFNFFKSQIFKSGIIKIKRI